MKSEDFERLKAVCEKEGFDVSTYKEDTNLGMLIHIKPKKDEWEGIEFFQFKGNHFKVEEFYPELIRGVDGLNYEKRYCTQSTEFAYIEQLKAECFKRFGEIKPDDAFNQAPFNDNRVSFMLGVNVELSFEKDTDTLFVGGCAIYYQGKWASRVPKRIEVESKRYNWNGEPVSGYNFKFEFRVKNGGHNTDMKHLSKFLASALEKFLNNE